jgi:hypothetical protein
LNTERSCSEVKLLWATKPERSCRAIKLTTVVAFVSAVFVRPVDVTHASYGLWQKTVIDTSARTTGPNPDKLGNSSKQAGIGRDPPVC